MQEISTQKCVASLHHAVASSKPDSQVRTFAQQLLSRLEAALTPGVPGPPGLPAVPVGKSVDETWQRARILSMANDGGRADELIKALNDRDERDAARRHHSSYNLGKGSFFDDFFTA